MHGFVDERGAPGGVLVFASSEMAVTTLHGERNLFADHDCFVGEPPKVASFPEGRCGDFKFGGGQVDVVLDSTPCC